MWHFGRALADTFRSRRAGSPSGSPPQQAPCQRMRLPRRVPNAPDRSAHLAVREGAHNGKGAWPRGHAPLPTRLDPLDLVGLAELVEVVDQLDPEHELIVRQALIASDVVAAVLEELVLLAVVLVDP